MLTNFVNFELKRLEPKLDIVEKPENRVHELTDSNGARLDMCGDVTIYVGKKPPWGLIFYSLNI